MVREVRPCVGNAQGQARINKVCKPGFVTLMFRYSCIARLPPIHTLTRKETFAYLRDERRRLMQQHRRLFRDFKALRAAWFPPVEWAAHRERVHEFQGLLANHRIAYQWALHPPCGRIRATQRPPSAAPVGNRRRQRAA